MSERFYLPGLCDASEVVLDGDEAHHLTRVCRLGVGDEVVLFDGGGVEARAIIASVGKHEVTLRVGRARPVSRELPFALVLACPPPKGDRLRWLIEKLTELGVARYVPLVTNRANEAARGVKPDKLRRWVIEASKQCGRNVLMEVTEPTAWREFLESAPSGAVRLLAHAAGGALHPIESDSTRDGVFVAIGPEGDFTADELSQARERHWQIVSLGPRILRVETAAVTAVASIAAVTRP